MVNELGSQIACKAYLDDFQFAARLIFFVCDVLGQNYIDALSFFNIFRFYERSTK